MEINKMNFLEPEKQLGIIERAARPRQELWQDASLER